MGVGLCIVGVSVLLGISMDSEKVYVLYLPPGLVLFGIGMLLQRREA